MKPRLLLCLSHAIEEYDQIRLFSRLGYEVLSLGTYLDPAVPGTDMRPALPDAPRFPELVSTVRALPGEPQADIPQIVLDWLGDDGIVIYHHYLDRLFDQWRRIEDWMRGTPFRRVIWRTVGQSVENNERQARPFRRHGLEVVRYSPKERNIPGYCGEDALIRFYKSRDDWFGWRGDDCRVTNVTQDLAKRGVWCHADVWERMTTGLPTCPAGTGSEALGGVGQLTYDQMRDWLRSARAYLYLGTQPASYTLGLIEAMMTGIPVVSIGPEHARIFPYGPDLFEGHEIAVLADGRPEAASTLLRELLHDKGYADYISTQTRTRAMSLFDEATVAAQWQDFLGG